MMISSTLPELLLARSQTSIAELGFLDFDGNITTSQTYRQLMVDAEAFAERLISAGLKPDSTDIIVTSFTDHESHIRAFWGCCLAGIPLCPIPPLHPDESRRTLFLEHLQTLFNQPTLLADEHTIQTVRDLIPDFKSISLTELQSVTINTSAYLKVFPNRCPKPDDIVCLMLTSGSTGNSKAVGLRHSNLLSCVRGKIKHHQTTEVSRFLNWIAFDHVACVSEVHLQALLADASQYHVSPPSIIRNPRNLLEWCSKLKITYTFSPNFLLAQICRDLADPSSDNNEIDLSCVRAFISGGEAVPVKTAIEFTNILERFGAPRDVLRAGFGMTETGAGCIYDTRPIPHDTSGFTAKYLSLGKCCDGTSMRAVDPETGAVCQPLQEGQLQLKGPTIFEEYFNNPAATLESFSDGWFITGDVAQFDHDGNLYLMGRDKDCININGVKHPSVDVEHYIEDLKIDGLMKSFVYACPMRLPNADTETYGVFYQHDIFVENTLSKEDTSAITATNRAVRAASGLFCSQAPHVVLPLPRKSFVKTALGKISRSTLAKTYLEGGFQTIEDLLAVFSKETTGAEDIPRDGVEQKVFETVAFIFNAEVSSLRRSQSLFDMGASSIHLMQLKQVLQERLSIKDIPTITFLQKPELGQLSDYILGLSIRTPEAQTLSTMEYNPLVCFNPAGKKPPLFLIHPGVGEVLVFINLAHVLADDRPVYALRARGFDEGQTSFTSFDEMVGCYTLAIEKCYPEGPFFLAGYSFGGAVAFEIGKRLTKHGKQVAWVGIFNLPPHIQFRMKELVWVEVFVNLCMFLALIPTTGFESLKAALQAAYPEIEHSDAEPASSAQIIQWVFEHCDQDRLKTLQLNLEDFRRWVGVAYKLSYTGRNYEPSSFIPGALLTVFCAVPLPSMGTREEFKRDRLSKWKDFTRDGFELVDVDGEHYTMISEDHVHSFAEKLRDALHRAEHAIVQTNVEPKRTALRPKLDFDEVPIIDFALAESDPETYFKQLSFALEDVGFGVFTNVPGFDDTFQRELFSLAEGLFSKPWEWKESLGTSNSYALRGYFRADDIIGHHKAHAEAYRFGADMPVPEANEDVEVPFWLRLHEGPNQWPPEEDLPTFRSRMEILFERYRALNLILNRHICQLLDIPSSVLDDFFPEKTEFNSALWHYFPVSPELQREARDGFVQGMHEHRDPSTFVTCLIQSRPGLQAQNHRGKWIDIPMVEGGVVCNIGMQLMKLTGGRLVATLHRVNTLKINKDRYTIPYVLSTKLEKPVLPLPQFTNPELAKMHATPNPRIQKLIEIEDPLIRSGFARLSLFPAVTKKLYPAEFEEGERMGIL
ncbi:acetyl-CoA synthetase-like protein [Collybia nuda]|uniref:Acetyl-CoA synthetase-like protein n=1 Tax=Collybia nuda TaxID=64659 RepID=A0A9P5YIF0_9AGAR|nr:acetyl-CoA synthetase-like protein [Collybia nuda]